MTHVREIAEAVADVLEERGLVSRRDETPGRVLKVAEVARLLGRSQTWVYEHAGELGAFKFTNSPKGRLGFDRLAIEKWKRERQVLDAAAPAPRKRPLSKQDPPRVPNLIPYDPLPHRA
jgi:predicted DNA-binding transcriptional regulator AlpA